MVLGREAERQTQRDRRGERDGRSREEDAAVEKVGLRGCG